MKAQLLTAEIGPEGLEFGEVDSPERVGDQILVDVKSCGVCFPDLLMTQGKYQLRVPLPFIPGTEVAGVVREAPPGVRFRVGDRVVVTSVTGGFAEQVAADLRHVLPLPDGLSFHQGAALGINYQTALFALKTRAKVLAGETVGILGAAGGVGTASIAVAKALGARVIAIVRRQGADALLRQAGADDIVALSPGWGSRLRESAPTGVDVMIDPSGGEVFDEALRQVAPDGRYVIVGFAAGEIPVVKLNRVLFRNVSIVGAAWGEYTRVFPGLPAQLHAELTDLIFRGLVPQVNVTYSLDQLPQALTDLAQGAILGKAVVTIAN